MQNKVLTYCALIGQNTKMTNNNGCKTLTCFTFTLTWAKKCENKGVGFIF